MNKEISRETDEDIDEDMYEDLFDDDGGEEYEENTRSETENADADDDESDDENDDGGEKSTEKRARRGKKHKKQKKHKHRRVSTVIISIVLVLMMFYYALTFLNIPPLRTIRNLWIETAMTTMTHQWLATYFFPDFIIDDIMDDRTQPLETITGLRESNKEDEDSETEKNDDILGQADLEVGGEDMAGNEILVNDIDQGIIISEVKTSTYTGRVALIDDPSRVFVGHTTKKGTIGLHIVDMLKAHNAIIGINASGFYDSGGHGNGGEVLGRSMSEGEEWGSYDSTMDSICFDTTNWLIAGKIEDWDEYNVRDGMQFTPVLVKDGEKNLNGTGGYGLQPRTCIGQREDGVVIFLVIDGRQPAHSLGATMLNCADIMLDYGAVTAVACDGGSSSVMAYDGKVITKPSGGDSVNGRYLPNAFMVKRK